MPAARIARRSFSASISGRRYSRLSGAEQSRYSLDAAIPATAVRPPVSLALDRRPADRDVGEALLGHLVRGEYVAQIDHHGLGHQTLVVARLLVAELVPLGRDDAQIRILQRIVGAAAIFDRVAEDFAGLLHALGS